METERPHLPGVVEVQQLTRQGVDTIVITPDTQVLCLHRGRRQTEDGKPVYHANASGNRRTGWREQYFAGDYKDTYDGNHYVVAPGYFTAPYGAAKHFQERAVVPGSRNPETQGQRSFIAIVGVVQAHPWRRLRGAQERRRPPGLGTLHRRAVPRLRNRVRGD
jgi:hypothetical protein